jgi:hypothetical protein
VRCLKGHWSLICCFALQSIVSCTGVLNTELLLRADLKILAGGPATIEGLDSSFITDAQEIYLLLSIENAERVAVFLNADCNGSPIWQDFAARLGPYSVEELNGSSAYSIKFLAKSGQVSCHSGTFIRDAQITRSPWFETKGDKFLNFIRNTDRPGISVPRTLKTF